MRTRTIRIAIATMCVMLAPTGTAVAAAPAPRPVPGGLTPKEADSTAPFGDCAQAGVVCKPQDQTGTCSGQTSQTTPPTTIKVYLGSTKKIQAMNFETYLDAVLPSEWDASWDGDAVKAGAVAVKSYAWYWVTERFGGYIDNDPKQCFDVTDDNNFQVYNPAKVTTRTTGIVRATWPVVARVNGRVLQASYQESLHDDSESCGAYADGTTMSQFGTQACNEANFGNKYNVILNKYYYPGLQLSTAQQLRTAHDFQFLQRSTRVLFANGTWSIDDGYPTTFHFGAAGDRPVVTTVGDGFARVSVFRPSTSTWYLASPTGGFLSKVHYGVTGDVPVAAQYAGVSKPTVLAVFRPSTGTWYEASASGATAYRLQYGERGDIPVPGHYFGSAANDYADSIALFRPSNGRWYVPGHESIVYGQAGDIPLPADYDGNGTTDLAVYRPSNHRFYVRGRASVEYGRTGDIPVTGDFTGDGRADLALYRPSVHTWYVYGYSGHVFGSGSATPIGKAPYAD